jgi:hypothetical protein
MNKDKMERERTLSRELAVTQDAIETIEEWNGLNQQPPPNPPPLVAVAPPDGDSSVASFGNEGDHIIEELVAERAAKSFRDTDEDEASVNSDYSLNSEECEMYAQIEVEMVME